MLPVILFALFSAPIIWISRKSLFRINHHGFCRLLAWECILWLALDNYAVWFVNPLSTLQIISWVLLFTSIFLVTAGALGIKTIGRANENRIDESLFEFEKTTRLVQTGIFAYIRHPLYSSLLFLTWGIWFKRITPETIIVSGIATVFLFATALMEEKEDVIFFGDAYVSYMKRTKRFVPFII